MYSSNLPLTSPLDGVGGQHQAPATILPGTTRYDEAWLAPGPVWTGAKNLVPHRNSIPGRPARSEYLIRLSYPGPLQNMYLDTIHMCFLNMTFNVLSGCQVSVLGVSFICPPCTILS
jgi:hypothetical protein